MPRLRRKLKLRAASAWQSRTAAVDLIESQALNANPRFGKYWQENLGSAFERMGPSQRAQSATSDIHNGHPYRALDRYGSFRLSVGSWPIASVSNESNTKL